MVSIYGSLTLRIEAASCRIFVEGIHARKIQGNYASLLRNESLTLGFHVVREKRNLVFSFSREFRCFARRKMYVIDVVHFKVSVEEART